MNPLKTVFLALLLFAASATLAQNIVNPPPENVVQLTANATVEVRQDLLTLTLATTREGSDPAAVQAELKTTLDSALAETKKNAEPGQLYVRTGNFSLYPRHTKEGRISTWLGSAELVLEGRDFARISEAAGRIQSLTVSEAGFSLSREQRSKAESEAQAAAIEQYKSNADRVAKSFGFSGYTLREISIGTNNQFPQPRSRMMAMEAKAAVASAPVPVEAGNSTVMVTVSGGVQLK